jgi:large subunit ribosomal protein L32
MPVPKKRTSRARRDRRRSHDAIKPMSAVQACPTCGELKLRHHICKACGTYRGESIVEVAKSE